MLINARLSSVYHYVQKHRVIAKIKEMMTNKMVENEIIPEEIFPEEIVPKDILPEEIMTIETSKTIIKDEQLNLLEQDPVVVKKIISKHFGMLPPLCVYSTPRSGPDRITLITNSINTDCVDAGVRISIIFAALLTESRNARLRIITFTQPVEASHVAQILSTYNIRLTHEIEFISVPLHNEIDIFDNELFIASNGCCLVSVMSSIRHDLIIWLVQEDDQMLYYHTDALIHFEHLFKNKNIRFAVNSKVLFDYLSHQFVEVAKNGLYFEPEFPKEIFYPRSPKEGEKFKFVFYAYPKMAHRLFYFGIELIDEAILRGILDISQWDIILVGSDIPSIIFSGQYIPKKYENLKLMDYAQLIGDADLGLSLMYAPHPGYSVLDLAASGAVAVTNRYSNKQDLQFYSKNILCSDLDKNLMLQALSEGIKLALNQNARKENYITNALETDVLAVFSNIIQQYSRET